MIQKIINGLALASFAVSAAVVGGGVYVYLNKDAMIENAKRGVTKAATEAITGALPGLIDAAMPELPTATGGALPASPAVPKL
jgi:phage tail protein X